MRRTAISDLKQRRHFKKASLWTIKKWFIPDCGQTLLVASYQLKESHLDHHERGGEQGCDQDRGRQPHLTVKNGSFRLPHYFMKSRWCKMQEFTILLHISNMKWKEQVKVITQTLDPIRKEYKNYENYCPKAMTTFIIVFVDLPMGTPRSLCLIGASVSCHVHHRNLAPGSKSWPFNHFAFSINSCALFWVRNLKKLPLTKKRERACRPFGFSFKPLLLWGGGGGSGFCPNYVRDFCPNYGQEFGLVCKSKSITSRWRLSPFLWYHKGRRSIRQVYRPGMKRPIKEGRVCLKWK